MTHRQCLNKFEFAVIFHRLDGKCGCGCGEPLVEGEIDAEHSIPVALNGKAKPDSLWRRQCHKAKTKGDVKNIAKVNRIIGKRNGTFNVNRKPLSSRNTLGGDEYRKRKEWAKAIKDDRKG